MSLFAKPIVVSIAAILFTFSAAKAEGNSWRHLQDMALDIQLKSDRLLGETHHYVHTAHYQTMLRTISHMRRKAVRVHVLAIQRGCLFEMERELRMLDRNFHRVEELFGHTEHDAAIGVGHIHGKTSHVRDLLHCIEDDIHHIMEDITSLRIPVAPMPPVRPYSGCYGNSGWAAGNYNRNTLYFGSRNHAAPQSPARSAHYEREWRGQDGYRYRDTGFSFRFNF
ncbi:MAG: hypothetical protein P8J33_02615 [Pirellulaceae bacterium]|nr:hypothetical protein [Pirellulaceae bacterium]